jgi:hypothetical protein
MNIFLLIIVIILFSICIKNNHEHFLTDSIVSRYSFMSRPSKCFSCEKEAIRLWGPEYAWKAQNTKCFSCERHLLKSNNNNPAMGALAGPTKCFDCVQKMNGYIPVPYALKN